MPLWETYLIVVGGVLLSIVLPILRKLLPKPPTAFAEFWHGVGQYIVVGIFSLAAAILVLAIKGNVVLDWPTALLLGYAWDSTLQKFGT